MSILNTDLNNINVNDNNYDKNMIILIYDNYNNTSKP